MFSLSPASLLELLDPKSPAKLAELGGVAELALKLFSNIDHGISNSDYKVLVNPSASSVEPPSGGEAAATTSTTDSGKEHVERRAFYADNSLPAPHTKKFWEFAWEALQDKTLIFLMIAAVVEIAVAIYKAVSNGETAGIYDGIAIIVAVLIVVLVSSVNDFRKQGQFRSLNDYSRGLAQTKVIRNGSTLQVGNADLMVGDVVIIDTGDVIPADGVFISGFNLKCDESSLTGESDASLKGNGSADPFLISGTKVISGVGKMLVVGTGVNSLNGRILLNLNIESEDTPLQTKLTELADTIAKYGVAAAAAMVVILIITYFTAGTNRQGVIIAEDIVNIIISAITVIVVAVPEGLPLAVTLALAHATLRMLKDNNLVRHLAACETMGNATTICSDKTGTLTQNRMTVVKGLVLEHTFLLQDVPDALSNDILKDSSDKDAILKLLCCAINVNSSALETENPSDGKTMFTGSKTEVALLEFTRKLGFDYTTDRRGVTVSAVFPFSSESKKMASIVHMQSDFLNAQLGDKCGEYILFTKGASEIILESCDRVLTKSGKIVAITKSARETYASSIDQFAKNALRTLCVAIKPLASFQPASNHDDMAASSDAFDESNNGMILMGIFGIEDPVRSEVFEAVKTCQGAGIVVRMVTGDNSETARAIAKQCGILTAGGIVIEGPAFRKLSIEEMDRIAPKLQVMARSSPLDKQILVQCYKRLGETVAVTGDGTNDAPALKSADVGFSMGISGTEVAKEASDIVLMDDNFVSLVKAVVWGRSVYDSVRKFLQFQLTVNVTAVILTIITSLISTISTPTHVPHSVLSAVQLLWVNLIMDTFAALALATDNPTNDLLKRKPTKKTDPLINQDMWRQIIGQALYQIVVCFAIYLAPYAIFTRGQLIIDEFGVNLFTGTVVFNTFVMCQLFNELNCRSVSRGVHRNNTFLFIIFLSAGLQIILVQFGGKVFSTIPLDWSSWLICVAFGFGSLPVGFLIRLLPVKIVVAMTSDDPLTAADVEDDMIDLHRSVIETLESKYGTELGAKERQLWMLAIQRASSQLLVLGTFNSSHRNAFISGVNVGAQMAISVNKLRDSQDQTDDLSSLVPTIPSHGQELWRNAGRRIRRQATAVDAFRRYRRDNTLI